MQTSLKRLDALPVPPGAGEIRAFSLVRNELPRLAPLLERHFALGVDRWFFVDNGSTDGTAEFLRQQPRVHLFETHESYRDADCGHRWLTHLLEQFGRDSWNLLLDADEWFVMPDRKLRSFADLRSHLEAEVANALGATLVDVYGRGPIAERTLPTLPLQDDWFFDHPAAWPHPIVLNPLVQGGLRKRLFGIDCALAKVPFFRGGKGFWPTPGAHFAPQARQSTLRAALIHFKLSGNFSARATVEVTRGEHWKNAFEYVHYEKAMARDPQLSAYEPLVSMPLTDENLEAVGLLRGIESPATVLLPVETAGALLEQTLKSLAAQNHRPFEVVAWHHNNDAASAAMLRRWIPSQYPGKILGFDVLPDLARVVPPAAFDICALWELGRSRGPNALASQIDALVSRPNVVMVPTGTSIVFRKHALISEGHSHWPRIAQRYQVAERTTFPAVAAVRRKLADAFRRWGFIPA